MFLLPSDTKGGNAIKELTKFTTTIHGGKGILRTVVGVC